jgi:hypothetical protein
LQASVDLLGGRLVLPLPEGWPEDARVLEVRPSLELTTHSREDNFAAAQVGADRNLRCLWLASQSDFTAVIPGGVRTPILDLTLCPGSAPQGRYTLSGEAEAVTSEGLPVESSLEPVTFEHSLAPGPCPEPVEELASMRPHVWMTDAQAEPGQAFSVSLFSTASFDARKHGFLLTWDPGMLRVVWAAVRRDSERVEGGLVNYDPRSPGVSPEVVEHVMIPSPNPDFPPFSICRPCTGYAPEQTPRASLRFYNYSFGAEPRQPFLADTEYHHADVVFQVLPEAAPGATWIRFWEDPGTRRADHYAEAFRYVNPTPDEVRYLARPRLPGRVTILPPSGTLKLFVRGDANGDGDVVISDPIAMLGRLFGGDEEPSVCDDAADANDDGRLDISDAVFTLSWLFLGGRILPAPNFYPGTDATEDALGCGS